MTIIKQRFISIFSILVAWVQLSVGQESSNPNIVFILTDDLGFGDVACYNPYSEIPTPNLDRLAKEGMQFMDAHSPSTVCTPTRYALLTGQMPFRGGATRVFSGVGGPNLIKENQYTLQGMLKENGYRTGIFGKWHIGLSFQDSEGKRIVGKGIEGVMQIDYSKPILDSPIHRDFDEFFGTACCPTTDWLYAYIDGDRIPVPPTQKIDKTNLPKHIYSRDCRPGMIAPDFDMEEVDLVFLEKSQKFMRQHVEKTPDKPFFLLHSMQAVHLPSFPAKQFQGKTKQGPHGDFIYEMDWIVGELMKTLDELGVADNTIVMFGSDNGPETLAVIDMRNTYQHDGAHPWRGVKRDQWEGGHRTPFIIRWPGKIAPASVTHQMISLTDVVATCAAIIGAKVPNEAAEDSFNLLPILDGTQGDKPLRPHLIQQTWSRSYSIRIGDWKYLDHKSSAGNNYEGKQMSPYALPDTAPDTPGQLYDLSVDPGERYNLVEKFPEQAAKMKTRLDELVAEGSRSAPIRDE